MSGSVVRVTTGAAAGVLVMVAVPDLEWWRQALLTLAMAVMAVGASHADVEDARSAGPSFDGSGAK